MPTIKDELLPAHAEITLLMGAGDALRTALTEYQRVFLNRTDALTDVDVAVLARDGRLLVNLWTGVLDDKRQAFEELVEKGRLRAAVDAKRMAGLAGMPKEDGEP